MYIVSDFTNIPMKRPLCCFGPRDAPPWIFEYAQAIGKECFYRNLLLISGGARGVDTAFTLSFSSFPENNDRIWIHRPDPKRGIAGLFERSILALRHTRIFLGRVIIFIHEDKLAEQKGGSYFSFNEALKNNMIVLLITYSDSKITWSTYFDNSGECEQQSLTFK